jgi:hypothetical protein
MLIPVVIRLLELLLSKEEKHDNKEVQADHSLAKALREKCGEKTDDEIIEEAFA